MSCTTYLETGSFDPCFNLAFEEFVLCNRTEGDYLLLWQNRNTVVVGRNQNTEEGRSTGRLSADTGFMWCGG